MKKLLALGVKFRAGYHSSAKAEEAKQRGVDSVAIDFANPEALQLLLRGVDKLFLISGNIPHQDELELNVVREAKKAGVRHIVKNSAWGAESEAFTFAKVHRPVEREIEASGVAYTFLRPNGYMQRSKRRALSICLPGKPGSVISTSEISPAWLQRFSLKPATSGKLTI